MSALGRGGGGRDLSGLMEGQALDGGVWGEREEARRSEGGKEKGRGGGGVGLSITFSCATWPFLSRTTWQNPREVEGEDRERREKEREGTVRGSGVDAIMVLSVAQN